MVNSCVKEVDGRGEFDRANPLGMAGPTSHKKDYHLVPRND
jgi:hypothetical protein